MPSPFGEGQTDTAINHHNQGEVATKPLSRLPQGGEANAPSTNIDLETQYAIRAEKKSSPCPLPWERGKPTRRLITTIRVRSHLIYS